MRIAAWNLNHRVGKTRFRPEAASAAARLNADLCVLTEYFPRDGHEAFCQVLADAGYRHQVLSREVEEVANRTLIVSRQDLEPDDVALPQHDRQLPSNVATCRLRTAGLRGVGLRVPWYVKQRGLRRKAWEWIETVSGELLGSGPAVLVGDFNAACTGSRGLVGSCLHRLRQRGWKLADVDGYSYFAVPGRCSAIDHLLATPDIDILRSQYVTRAGEFEWPAPAVLCQTMPPWSSISPWLPDDVSCGRRTH